MNRVQGISVSFSEAIEHSPASWVLVGLLLLLAIFIGGYYIQEKFIYKRRFQGHVQLKTATDRAQRESHLRDHPVSPPPAHPANVVRHTPTHGRR